jgi:hypothetical protein
LDKAQAFMITLDHELDSPAAAGELVAAPRAGIGDSKREEAGGRMQSGPPAMRASSGAPDRRRRLASVPAGTSLKRPPAGLAGAFERPPLERVNGNRSRGRWDDDPS